MSNNDTTGFGIEVDDVKPWLMTANVERYNYRARVFDNIKEEFAWAETHDMAVAMAAIAFYRSYTEPHE